MIHCFFLLRSSNGSSTWRHLISYKNMLRAIENIGVEMSLGLRFYARNELSKVIFFEDDDGRGDNYNGDDHCQDQPYMFLLLQVNFAKFIEHQKLSIEYMKQVPQFLYPLPYQ